MCILFGAQCLSQLSTFISIGLYNNQKAFKEMHISVKKSIMENKMLLIFQKTTKETHQKQR